MLTGEIQIRVRYAETDRMGLLHHANYLVYFEQARTELLRQSGRDYKTIEDQGYFLVITRAEVKYKHPAHYDEVLTIRTTVTRTSPVRLEHKYEVFNPAGRVVAEGGTTLACVDRQGKLQAMPDWLTETK
jgi:acyl-CoA thioester hydrolase